MRSILVPLKGERFSPFRDDDDEIASKKYERKTFFSPKKAIFSLSFSPLKGERFSPGGEGF